MYPKMVKKRLLILMSTSLLSGVLCYTAFFSPTIDRIPKDVDIKSGNIDGQMAVMSKPAQDVSVVKSVSGTREQDNGTKSVQKKEKYILRMSEIKTLTFLDNYRNPCWYYKEKLTCLPYLIIAGFSKCGTTDLQSRVGSHPLVLLKSRETMHLYLNVEVYNGVGVRCEGDVHCGTAYYASKAFEHPSQVIAQSDDYQKMNAHLQHFKGVSEESKAFFNETVKHVQFLKSFPKESAAIFKKAQKQFKYPLITVEATSFVAENNHRWKQIAENQGLKGPRYTTADWMQRINPDARIIFTLRDPVERVFSHYVYSSTRIIKRPVSLEDFHKRAEAAVKRVNTCLRKGAPLIACAIPQHDLAIGIGLYAVHLRNWLDKFPRNNFFFSKFEDYKNNTSHVLEQIYKFLHLPPVSKKAMDFIARVEIENVTEKKKSMEMWPETRKLLTEFYTPHVREVAKLLNDDRFLWHYGRG